MRKWVWVAVECSFKGAHDRVVSTTIPYDRQAPSPTLLHQHVAKNIVLSLKFLVTVAPVPRELHRVVHPLLIRYFPQQRMAHDMRRDLKLLVRREVRIRLPSHPLQNGKRLAPVERFPTAGGEQGAWRITPLFQSLVQHLAVLLLHRDALLHVAALAQHVDESSAVRLVALQG